MNENTKYFGENKKSFVSKSKFHDFTSCNTLNCQICITRSPLSTINKSSNRYTNKSTFIFDESLGRCLKQKDNPQDPFGSISDEILLKIFSYLPKKTLNRIAMVNKRFCRVTQDQTLWIRMDFGNKLLRRGSMSSLLTRGIKILRLSQTKIMSPIFASHFVPEGYVSNLEYLDLSMAFIDTTSLAQLLRVCRRLKKLSLEALSLDMSICREISANKSLETLNLTMCEGLTQEAVLLMMVNLQKLVELNISWTHLTKVAIDSLTRNISSDIKRLNVAGCEETLTDKHIKILASRCPKIVELNVSDCSLLTKATFFHVQLFPRLEYLSISRCYNIPLSASGMLNSIQTLKFLDIYDTLTDDGVADFKEKFKHLGINKFIFSTVARPTVEHRRTSIWEIATRT